MAHSRHPSAPLSRGAHHSFDSNLLLLTHTAASSSRRAALGVALGITTGTFIWVAVAVFGVQQIFAAVPTLQFALKVVGGAYLLYLAFGMFQMLWLRALALTPTRLRIRPRIQPNPALCKRLASRITAAVCSPI